MTPLPINQIGFDLSSYNSALWWVNLSYRRPHKFISALMQLPRKQSVFAGLMIYFHLFIFFTAFIIFIFLSRYCLNMLPSDLTLYNGCLFFALYLARIAFGILFGFFLRFFSELPNGIDNSLNSGLVSGIIWGFAFGFGAGLPNNENVNIFSIIVYSIALSTTFVINCRSAFVIGLLLTFYHCIMINVTVGVILGFAFAVGSLRLYYIPFHWVFLWPRVHGNWYPHHPVAWDDLCVVPFSHLDKLLVTYAEHNPEAAEREIERLITEYPSQRVSALRARTILIARQSVRENDLTKLSIIVDRLPEGEKGFLAETHRICEMVNTISLSQVRLDCAERPIFRELLAQSLCTAIETFKFQIAGFHEPLVSEFRSASSEWMKIASQQLEEICRKTKSEPMPQIFRAGDPVNREQEAFVPRYSVFGELERQIMLSTGCPGLVLYGRRRMGKSTILKNVSAFLPESITASTISMQNPSAFTSLGSFIKLIVDGISKTRSDIEVSDNIPHDLPEFFDFLTTWNEALACDGKRLLLCVDEYENIDEKIGTGVFPEDLLATLRESIQSHRQLTWMFAGSHEVDEFTHAPWTSYLVSARTILVQPFTVAETRMLLTEPLKYSPMWASDDPKRPCFDAALWGDNGIERIHAEAAGWPHLVQLIAETTVDLLNDTDQRRVDPLLLEQALEQAIDRGHNVLSLLMKGECSLPNEWDYLRGFHTHNEQPPPDDEDVCHSLHRRLLVVDEGGLFRLRVPLMQRWLRQRG